MLVDQRGPDRRIALTRDRVAHILASGVCEAAV